jgi:hypothetical protein
MRQAICLKCGHAKRRPAERCKHCGLDPEVDDDTLVKSVYLSLGRFDDASRHEAYSKELEALARDIKAGRPLALDPAELERLRSQLGQVRSVPASAVWGALFRFLLPGIVVFGILIAIWIWRVTH